MSGTAGWQEGYWRMKRLFLPLMAAAALSACTGSRPQADVTRFHLNQPIPNGTLYVTSADPRQAETLEQRAYNQTVAAELQRMGFTMAAQTEAEYLAAVSVTQEQRQGIPRRSGGVSIGIGGGFSSGNVGMGGSVQVPVGGQKQGPTFATTTLAVTITRQSDKSTVWEGRATMESSGGPATDVPQLAAILFRDFPGASGQTVRVTL